VTHRREHDYRFEPIHYAADRSPLYDHFADIHPRPQRTPPPSVMSGLSADSDADSDYIPPAQRTRRPPSRLSAASGRPASVASHHSDAVQLASKLADTLQDQLIQACERQQRLDQERQNVFAREERALVRAETERIAAYEREQRDRQALLDREDRQRQLAIDREDRQRERELSDLLELADQRVRAAALEQQLQHLQDTAAQLPAPPSITTLALVTSTQPDMSPAVTVAQLVDTSVPSTPLSTHAGLHSLTGIVTSAAAYPARSALQRAADIYDQLPSLSGLLDTPVWVPRSVPMLPPASANTAVTSLKPALERASAFYDRLPSVPEYPVWLHTVQSTTPHVPPLTTLPTFTTATPRPAVLPLSGTGGPPLSAPPPPLASGYLPHTAALPWSVAQHHISPPAPHTQWSTIDLPQSHIHVPPTFQVTADVQGPTRRLLLLTVLLLYLHHCLQLVH